jgi:sacsin
MLQNADDAGATELHVILDHVEHPKDTVVSEEMKEAQGASILIYNDKPFTEEDVKSIQKLGVGGKRDDMTKTGKFGLGFNVCYHVTDVSPII